MSGMAMAELVEICAVDSPKPVLTNAVPGDAFFKKELNWDYKVGDREDYVLSQKATETFTISSDFLTDKVAEWLKELIVSTEVYIIDNSGQKFPIIINDTSYQVKTRLNDKIFSVVINYRMAYQTNTAQG